MPSIRLVVVALGLWFGVFVVAAGEPAFDEARLKQIPQRMMEFIDAGKISGAVTLVATKDRVVHVAAVGQVDIGQQRTMQPDAIFRVASMTKLVTATALMQLVAEGKVQVSDPVAKYIPAFANQTVKEGQGTRPLAKPVTIQQVLTHTAGLSNPRAPQTDGMTLAQLVDSIAAQPLAFEPGSKWEYSSGLTIAGRIIEVVSGQDYADYLKARIFQPLGMTDTTFQLTKAQAARLAVTYKPGETPGTLAAVEIPDPTAARAPGPSGGLYSTAADMARFYQAILNGGQLGDVRILPAEQVKAMTTILTPGIVTGFTPGNGWGLGWCVVEKPQSVTRLLSPGTFGHGGAWGTQGWVDPQRGLILILMIQRSNFGNSDASDVRDAFTEAALTAYRGAESETAKFVAVGGSPHCVEIKQGDAKAVLSPSGGRVLEFSAGGHNAMYLDPQELTAAVQKNPPMTAGRFDFGPELTVPAHPKIWSGAWTAEITGPMSARFVSPRDESSGVQLIRDFTLQAGSAASAPRLSCRQTICNVSTEVREYCHWGRSFSPGGGIALVPLAGTSRFPSKYAMYEESATINVRNTDDRIRERDGFLEILAPPRKPKLGFDSYAGWLGYLHPTGMLFVKRFATHPDRVYNEAAGLTLSVWYPDGPRIELEPIGPRERLQPGDAASFTEEWHLLKHPFPKAGEQIDLAKLREQVQRETGMGK
ncbi:MAG TPA: serine hydrolase domain-containing protein [Planctomycetaceae bacterium]|nr:serine hydrolase domain-containing protein [Planctomycetaceae bacterium]